MKLVGREIVLLLAGEKLKAVTSVEGGPEDM